MAVIVVRDARNAPRLDARVVKRRAERMLAELGEAGAELSVLLTDDERIHELNARHRRKDKPTDVLSFPMDAGDGEASRGPKTRLPVRLLGDVVISLPTAARQARERRKPLLAEVTDLLAHGMLHLVGYDHRTDAEERSMNLAAEKLTFAATRRAHVSKR
ncbi:MAG TPA: rRNA maturation RNase YbeY [Polyangiaceae bacterium]|nr:rRNA maturation RNase YbeY [Polyangiaceae bacterium]